MREETIEILKFNELSDAAKERARSWYREAGNGDEWWDSVYDDADQAAALMGITLKRKEKDTPAIWFSGFWSQGDGAKFEGYYSYQKGAVKAIKAEWPKDEELHRIAQGLQDVQRRWFYKLEATCTDAHRGSHSGCMGVDVELSDGRYRDIGGAEQEVKDLLRAFADWIYSRLEQEDEWLNSDAQVDENIEANEYEFEVDGSLYT